MVIEGTDTTREAVAWAGCGKPMPDHQNAWTLSARVKPGINLSLWEGKVLRMEVLPARRVVPVVVVGCNASAKRAGCDLVFLLCSPGCRQALRDELKTENPYSQGMFSFPSMEERCSFVPNPGPSRK